MRLMAASLAVAVLTACTSTSRHSVEFLSEPPGARISVNNEYMGDAPLTIDLVRKSDRFMPSTFVIEAYPPAESEGLTVQRKYIGAYDDIPKRMLFDLRLKRVAPKQEIDAKVRLQSE